MVELTLERPDGSLAFIANDGSGPSATARLQLVSPGPYACPVGCGAEGADAFLFKPTAARYVMMESFSAGPGWVLCACYRWQLCGQRARGALQRRAGERQLCLRTRRRRPSSGCAQA